MNGMSRIVVLFMACLLMGATHVGPAYATRPYYVVDNFGKALAREHRLEFLNGGLGSLAEARQGIWALNLVSRQQMTLEEGRQLARDISCKFLDKVCKDPVFASYCRKTGSPLKKECVAFRLAFWDKNTDRPSYPFLAQIRLADGKLYYHYADPDTLILQEPIVEDLDVSNLKLPI